MSFRLRSAVRRAICGLFGEEAAARAAALYRRAAVAPQPEPEPLWPDSEHASPAAAFRAYVDERIDEDADSRAADEFFLTEADGSFASADGSVAWAAAAYRGAPYTGLALRAGASVSTPLLTIGNDTTLVCEIAMGAIDVALQVPGVTRDIGRVEVPSLVTVDLSALNGLTGWISMRARTDAVILKWIVARSDRVGLLHGRSNYARRLATESQFFTGVYDHEIYRSRGQSEDAAPFDAPRGGFRPDAERLPDGDAVGALPAADVRSDDNAYVYGVRLLEALVGRSEPDFASRLAALHANGPVRLLSLCSGVAGIERQIIERAGVPAEITLYDINPTLMGRAAATLSPFARVFGVIGDVNEIDPQRFDHPYDVVMCVSGLHHVVELERVLSAAADLLVPGGEFWVVGEQIGRSGNRLWPEVRDAANSAFRALPAELRRNSIDGVTDAALREMDYSSTTFEGIRSEEIEALLSRYFEPVEVYRRNCFLWRTLEPSYFANYDLNVPAHRAAIHGLVAAEYATWRTGGRPTETWAAYRARQSAR